MGVPKQVRDMEAEADKELAAAAEAPKVEQPKQEQAETPAPQTPPPEEQPKQEAKPLLGDIGTGDAPPVSAEELAQREQRVRSMMGRLNKEHEDWKKEREAYEQQIAALKRERDEAVQRGVEAEQNRPAQSSRDSLRAIFGDSYDDESLEKFEKAVDTLAERKLEKLNQKLAKLDDENLSRRKAAAEGKVREFKQKLDADFPGFREFDEKGDARWLAFLKKSPGGMFDDISYGDIAKAALQSVNYRKFAEVVRAFANDAGIVFSPNGKPIDGGVVGQVRPSSVPSQGRQEPQKQRVVPRAEIEQFRRDAFAHKAAQKYGLTEEQVRQQLRFYEDAEADGRVA